MGAEISTLYSLGCLEKINGFSRRVMGIFKPSLTQCQENQTWKLMAMTRRAFTLEEESSFYPWLLELLDQRWTVHLIDNRGSTGQCFPNLSPGDPKDISCQISLPGFCQFGGVLAKKGEKGRRGQHLQKLSPRLCAGGLNSTISPYSLQSLREQGAVLAPQVSER